VRRDLYRQEKKPKAALRQPERSIRQSHSNEWQNQSLARRAVVFKHTKERDMKVFVWADVGQCSYSYHSGGGVVVFAETEQRAREIANAHEGCAIQENEAPDDVRDVAGGDERVFIMPDAGCC
jgi:hypothetical protein